MPVRRRAPGETIVKYPLRINISDSWKSAEKAWINIGDDWKEVTGIQINIGDVWKRVW